MSLAEDIKSKAKEIGFDLVGITDAGPIGAKQVQRLSEWLKAGCAADMAYMHRYFEKRVNPGKLLENAQSVIVAGLNYTPPEVSKNQDKSTPTGRISAYAQYEDYHTFIKNLLGELTRYIESLAYKKPKFKICVDSVPLAERALAERAGVGFIGKNHILINPKIGCRIFLGEIITDLKIETDKPIAADCANCDKCVRACPTGALNADGRFEAQKCISYLTIEHKGKILPELSAKIGDRLFGCDECVLACPYQENAPVCKNKQFKFYPDRAELNLNEILNLNQAGFEKRFAHSVIHRAGLERLKRNAGICLENALR